ncbi:MAG: NAD(P)-dependent oxidoreductase [Steroidobacteraceae bacterium]
MRIALIGATGYVGSRILTEALNRGHYVTAIVRDTSKLPVHARLTPKRGDIFDTDGLPALLAGHDVVISAVQFTKSDPHLLINAVKKAKVPRYLVMGGMGSLITPSGMMVVDDPAFPKSVKPIHKDPNIEAPAGIVFLNVLKSETELDWTFLSPSGKPVPGQRTGKFRVGKDHLLVDNNGKISNLSLEDIAVAMLDEVEKPQHSRQRFTIGY